MVTVNAQGSASDTPVVEKRFFICGAALLAVALLLYSAAVLAFNYKRTPWFDLGPYPDAVEYFAQARSLLRGEGPVIQIGHERLPSRYPPGYPILMLPWLLLSAKAPVLAPFRTNQSLGLIFLVALFIFYCSMQRPLGGGVATLLFAVMPAFVTYSRSSLSDLSGSLSAVVVFVLMYLGLRRKKRLFVYLAGVAAGISILIRPQLLFFSPILIGMALFPSPESIRRRLLHCVLLGFVFLLAASPYLILNAMEFGSPLRTGYDFWVTGLKVFSLHNIPQQLQMLGGEITATWKDFRVAHLFGTGCYIVPGFFALAVSGLYFIRWDRFTIAALCGAGAFFVITLTYRFVDPRFFMPLFFLLVFIAVQPVEWAGEQLLRRGGSVAALAVFLLLLSAIAGYPSQSGYKPRSNRVQLWDEFHFRAGLQEPIDYPAQRAFARRFAGSSALVLSVIDPVYLNALWPAGLVAAPLDGNHHYRNSGYWHYGKEQAEALARSAMDKDVPVYALLVSARGGTEERRRLPTIGGYNWLRVPASDPHAAIFKLADVSKGVP